MGAKVRKVEHKTKKLVSFFVEKEYLRDILSQRYEKTRRYRQLTVPSAVRNAVSAATIIFTTSSIIFFFSFIEDLC